MDTYESLRKLEQRCQEADYEGHCKFDALNSPVLESLFGATSLTRLLTTQAVNRVPLPLRSVFRVTKGRNPKGIANFIRGFHALSSFESSLSREVEVRKLSEWLLQNDSTKKGMYGGPGVAWGYHFPWQSPGFFAPRHSPNCIVTAFCGEGLLSAYLLTREESFLECALGAKDYLLKGLPVLEETRHEKCIGYVAHGLKWRVIHINAVAAGFLAKLARVTKNEELMDEARKMINWVLGAKTRESSWNYTQPKSQSGIGPDNSHTGAILDGIADYMECSGDKRPAGAFWSALDFYRRFFTAQGGPKWSERREFPMDIHGAAQGILTFSKATLWEGGCLFEAERVAGWAIKEMQDPSTGGFYYQKFKHFTWKLELMRWNNSWMFRSLAEFLAAKARLSAGTHRTDSHAA